MSTAWALTLAVLLLVINAFFVAAEFALVASKRYRLEQAAATGTRAARAALAGNRELSLMLAGAQLGITVCTLGLGALAEPAIERLLSPLIGAAGLGTAASHAVAVVIALAVVTFLHLVVGEMAPKSWAITDPERSALMLALPFRAFARVARPALAVLNRLSNATLRLIGVRPQEQLAALVHGPDELRILLEQSRVHGLLPVDQHRMLTSMLQLQGTRVADIMEPVERIVSVRPEDDAERVEAVCRESGRSRVAVLDGPNSVTGIVHVRDVVRATTEGTRVTARELMAPPFTLPATATVTEAVAAMRAERAQLALVTAAPGTNAVGFVALEDLLEEVIGEFDDETDPVPRGRRMR
jgi:CBS domain containing-hemolysin-like protein